MKKSMLFCGLLSVLSSFAYAATPPAKNNKTPAPAAATPSPAPAAKPATQSVATPFVAAAAPAPVQAINCLYKIPPKTARIESSLVQKWAEKAAQQSFDFNPGTLDNQLNDLKPCYTEQGWQSFYDALQKSGNIKAIKSQNLMVSSLINGTVSISEAKDNQWKVSMPLQVVYQNENEKLTQGLTVDLLVGRKPSGDLGIMQIIASPRQEVNINDNKKPVTAPAVKKKS